jgi:ankyrin repeat protein
MKAFPAYLLALVLTALVAGAARADETDIHTAARNGDATQVEQLLESGADVNGADDRGFTPLLWAVYGGFRDVVELLIERGADVAYEHPAFGSAAALAFHMECQKGQSGMTELLVSRGAGFDPDGVGPRGLNRLRVAVMLGSTDMVRWLIERGADVNAPSPKDGRAALLWAAQKGHIDIVDALIGAGADVNAGDAVGIVPLQWASENGHTDVVRILVESGARVDRREAESGQGLMHRVSIYGHVEIARLLLSRGADPVGKDAAGRAPVYYACRYGHEQLAGLLVENGASWDDCEQKNFGISPLLTRAMSDREAAVWKLASRGWAVRTAGGMLVFDAEEFVVDRPTEPSLANGFVTPEQLAGDDVYAIYTCYHGEVGEPAYIHEIEDELDRVTYIHNADDPWRGNKHSFYLKPGETRDFGGLKTHTIWPIGYMPSLAYLWETGGLTVYYADVTSDDLDKYAKDLEWLAGFTETVDIAFLPAADFDADSESDLKMFVEKFSPRAIFLLHTDNNGGTAGAVTQWLNSRSLDIPVLDARYPGDSFVFRDGVVQ